MEKQEITEDCPKIANFINHYPEYILIPATLIARYFAIAGIFFDDEDGPLLKGKALLLAQELLCAHCLCLYQNQHNNQTQQNNQTMQIPIQSSIDKVSLQFCPPQFTNGFEYYANLTPYGQQLLALLKSQSAGGFYFGINNERQAFRKANGFF